MHRQTRTARLWTAIRRALAAYWTAVRTPPTDAELAEEQAW